jgi:hypothetical protein
MKRSNGILIMCALVLAAIPMVAAADCGCGGVVVVKSAPIVPQTIAGSYIGGVAACPNNQLCSQKFGSLTGETLPCTTGNGCTASMSKKLGQSSLLGKFKKGQ